MGKVRVFDIIFENPRNVFHSGQKVIGVLKIENTIPVKAQSRYSFMKLYFSTL